MENWIQTVRIQNFKSLKDVSLECERINLFVGKPNVGKSNLLEALALFGPNYLNSGLGFAKNLIRYESIADIFYDQNVFDEKIEITAKGFGQVEISIRQEQVFYEMKGRGKDFLTIETDLTGNNLKYNFDKNKLLSPVKRYQFPESQKFEKKSNWLFLSPPNGDNLITILQTNKTFREEVSDIFEPYGLELFVDTHGSRIEIVKKRDGILFKTPFSLIADTLRRYMFHLAAIESNRNSVLLFEEPESHNYPPYITQLANRIIQEKTNQYFITTHSPFLFNTLVEEAKGIAIFLLEYEDFQTKVRRLSEDNLREILDYGLNIFTEHDFFV